MDRGEAIGRAVELAALVDIIVIAGKGHEKTQILGDRELPFDDVEVAIAAIATIPQSAARKRSEDDR